MQPLLRIPLTKCFAVTAALACAGGGVFIGRSGAASGATTASLDHYLCVGHGHALCEPVAVTLADGTQVGVTDPADHLVCAPPPRPRHPVTTPGSVSITNELAPAPVPLVTGRLRWNCTVTPPRTFGRRAVRTAAVPLATYACSSVHYPPGSTVRFSRPAVTAGRVRLGVGDPSRLCVPTAPAPADANDSLLCFHAWFGAHRHDEALRLCVPSADPPAGGTTTTTAAPTTTASSTTTTHPTTTTTRPPTTTTTRPVPTTTTRPATTTTNAATTTTTSPPTTTSRPPTTQPCVGTFVNGVCIINA